MKILVCAAAYSALGGPLAAQPLQLSGKAGYLGEFEIKATLAEEIVDGKKQYSGPMTITHVGLCTHSGPNVVESKMNLRYVGWSSRVEASFEFEGATCHFDGRLTQSTGFMGCDGKPSVPFAIWRR
jgi:hypothetical protein